MGVNASLITRYDHRILGQLDTITRYCLISVFGGGFVRVTTIAVTKHLT